MKFAIMYFLIAWGTFAGIQVYGDLHVPEEDRASFVYEILVAAAWPITYGIYFGYKVASLEMEV